MMVSLRNMKVKTKVTLLAAFLLFVVVVMSGIAILNQVETSRKNIKTLEVNIRTGYDRNIKNQVENAISLLTEIDKKQKQGEYTVEEAKKLVLI